MLYSSKAVTKETMQMAPGLGRSSPDPRLGAPVELRRGHACRLLELIGIGKTLSSERIAAKEAPPAFLQIEPACSFGNEKMLKTRMLCQPGAGLGARVATEIVGDDKDGAGWISRFDVSEQGNVPFRVARSRAASDLLAITDPQGSIDPYLLLAAAIIQRGFNAMTIRRPARAGRECPWDYRSEFVGADGRRPLGWFGVVGDDRRPFGTKSGSSLLPQLCV
jgi:hypothetical protein